MVQNCSEKENGPTVKEGIGWAEFAPCILHLVSSSTKDLYTEPRVLRGMDVRRTPSTKREQRHLEEHLPPHSDTQLHLVSSQMDFL